MQTAAARRRTRSALVLVALVASTLVAATGASAYERGDAAHERRERMFDELASRVPTDSLAKLYAAALNAPEERGRVLLDAVSCQTLRLDWAYGNIPARRAVRRMTDSLFPTPELRQRFADAQDRWPVVAGVSFECVRGLVPAADSLNE
jgi:hypothetical protein